MRIRAAAAVLLTALPLTAASAMDVATFLAKAEALEKKGMMALLSPDLNLLKSDIETAAEALRQERLAAQRARRKPAYCPPAATSLGPKDILDAMRAVPAAGRPRTQTKDALRAYFARRFPCR